jgi:hypothetical protein
LKHLSIIKPTNGGDQALQTLQPPNNSKRSVIPVGLISS